MNSKNKYFSLAVMFPSMFLLACAGTGKGPPGEEFLDQAIDALSGKIQCRESDFSTEDEDLLLAIKKRDFEVAEYSVDTLDGETTHRFLLRGNATPHPMLAEVVVADGQCKEYMFGKIVD